MIGRPTRDEIIQRHSTSDLRTCLLQLSGPCVITGMGRPAMHGDRS